MRRSNLVPIVVALGLAAVIVCLFAPVLDTGFWSPEDLRELSVAARAHARGQLPLAFQPSLAGGYFTNPVFGLEFRVFQMDPRPYFVMNLFVHWVNSLLAYLLVNTLLHDRRSAALAATLFALSVGSYGKNMMVATGISSLVYGTTILLGTLLYVLNEKRAQGRLFSVYALGFYVLFIGSLFMHGGTFSLLACFAFYNLFFRPERQRRVLHVNVLACLGLALGAQLARVIVAPGLATTPVDPGAFLRNVPGYLILMVFPLHQSELLSTASSFVRTVYAVAPVIRILVGLSILSYSLFCFVFGSRALRFYIAWMYVMVVPFAFLRYPSDWLNLRFLYIVSLGFCVLLTTGTLYAFKLLAHQRRRRWVAFAIPAGYVALTVALVLALDRKNEQLARSPATEERRAQITALLNS